MNVKTSATATSVHATRISAYSGKAQALCGAGVSRGAGSGATKVAKLIETDEPVTCKRCVRKAEAAAPQPRELPVFYTPVTRTRTTAARLPWEAGVLSASHAVQL